MMLIPHQTRVGDSLSSDTSLVSGVIQGKVMTFTNIFILAI